MNLLVISGGGHPYHESTPVLMDFLGKDGHEVRMTEDASILTTDEMQEFDALVFNTRRELELTLQENERVGLTQYVGGGHGFVCLHISGCRPAAWPEYHDLTGGGWITGESYHPPYGQFTVSVSDSDHPCAEGIGDFVTNDELYMNIASPPRQRGVSDGERRRRNTCLGPGSRAYFYARRRLRPGLDPKLWQRQGVQDYARTQRTQLPNSAVSTTGAERRELGNGQGLRAPNRISNP